MKHSLFTWFVFLFSITTGFSQVFTNREVGQKNQSYIDSLKSAEYPYALPIWGDRATKAGFSLPYSAGVSVNYLWQESDLILENLMVGFNGGQKLDVDDIVRFNTAVSRASAISVRPDVWLFPFLNVYGVLARTQASTEVGFGVWLPDSLNINSEVFSAGSKVDFNAGTFGIGMTPTIGVGGGFLALDLNITWTDVPQLQVPTRTFVFGPRFGKNFKLNKPESALAVWVGGFRIDINNEQSGSVNLNEVLPVDQLQPKVDLGFEKVELAQVRVDEWWEGLTRVERLNPVNIAKFTAANLAIEKASTFLVAVDGALNNGESSTVQYSMERRPADLWNFIVGSQYQLNKSLMFRAEVGFLGSRTQLMTGIQYRFGL
jgi:hypothetical protein